MGVRYEPMPDRITKAEKPGEWLEYSPLLTVVISFFGIAYLVGEVAAKGAGVILELNHYIFAFLIAGLLLHWRRASVAKLTLRERIQAIPNCHNVPSHLNENAP